MLQTDTDILLSLAAPAERRVNEYKVEIDGAEVTLEEQIVVGDGNCGFHALGVSREEFARTIVESKEIKDEANKVIIGKLVQGAFLNGQITEALPVWNDLVTTWKQLFNAEQSIKDNISGFVAELRSRGVNLDCKGEYNEMLDERISRLTGADQSRLIAYKSDLAQAERGLAEFFCRDDLIELYYTNGLQSRDNQGLDLWVDIPSIVIYAKIKKITIRVWEKIGNNLKIKDSHIEPGSEQQYDIVFVNNNHFNLLLRPDVNVEIDPQIVDEDYALPNFSKEESDSEIIDEDYTLLQFQLQDLQNEKIVLLDVDETLAISNSHYGRHDGGYRYNEVLINNLKQAGLTRVYLFTAYKLRSIAKTREDELVSAPSRYKLVEYLSQEGFEVMGVCTILDSIYNQGIGAYYRDKIRPYELRVQAGENLRENDDYKQELIQEVELSDQKTNKAMLYEYTVDRLGEQQIGGVLVADDRPCIIGSIQERSRSYPFPLETILVKPHDTDYSENIIRFQKAAYWHSIKKPLIYNQPQLHFLREEQALLLFHYEQMLKQEDILGAKVLRQKIIKWQQDIRATGVDYLNLKIESLNEMRGSFQLISQSGAEINLSVDIYKKIIKKVNNKGNSSVGYYNGVFYKQLISSCAIREQAVYEVSELLGGNLVTPTTVLKINLAEHQKVPVLAGRSSAVLDEIRKLAKNNMQDLRFNAEVSMIMQDLRFDADVSDRVLDYSGFSFSAGLKSLMPEDNVFGTMKEWCKKIDLVPNALMMQASLGAGQISLDNLLRIPKAVRWLEELLGREETIKLLPDLLNHSYKRAREGGESIEDEFRQKVAAWEDVDISYRQANFTESKFNIVEIEDILDLLEYVPIFRSQNLFELKDAIDVIRNITILYKNKPAEYIVENVSNITDNFAIDNLIAHGLLDLITTPMDHKGDNYRVIVEHDDAGNLLPFKIIAIDNDEALGKSLSFGPLGRQVCTQSMVLCLLMKSNYKDQMIPLHLRNRLANLDVGKFMLQLRLSEELKARFTLEEAGIRWSEVENTLTKLKDACMNDICWLDLFLRVKPITGLLYQQLAIDNNYDADWMIHNLMDPGVKVNSIDRYLLPKLSIDNQRRVEASLNEINSSRVRDGAIEFDCNLGDVTQELLLVLARHSRVKLALNIRVKDFIVVYNKMKNKLLDIIDIPKSRLILEDKSKVPINRDTLIGSFVREETFNVFSIIQYIDKLSLPDMMTRYHKSENLEIINRLIDLGGGEHLTVPAANSLYVRLRSCEPYLAAELLEQNAKLKWQYALGDLLEEINSTWQVQVLSLIEGEKQLKEKYRRELYPNGKFKRENLNGQRPSCKLMLSNDINIHVKKNPMLPGREIQVNELADLLFERVTAKVAFYKFIEKTVKSRWRSQPECLEYPVMVSDYIEGFTLNKIESNPIELAKITQSSFSKAFILALLINPEDGRGDNYMLSPRVQGGEVVYDIISIDNDQAFVEPLSYKGGRVDSSANGMQVKSIIYCLENMKDKLDTDVINNILKIDPYFLVITWLKKLQQHQERARPLFPDSNRFTTRVYEARVSDIYGRLTRIKKLLAKDREISAMRIFKDLMPGLASRYEDAINEYKLPSERFSSLTQGQFEEVKSKGVTRTLSKRTADQIVLMSRPPALDEKIEMVSPRDAISFLNKTIHLDTLQQLIKRGSLELFKKMERTQQEQVINGNDAKLSALNFAQFSMGSGNKILQALAQIDLRNLQLINVKSTKAYLNTIIKHSHAMKRLLIEKYNNADKWLLDYLGENLSQLEVLWIKNQPQLTDHDYVFTRYISPFQNLKELTLDSLSNLLTLDISIPNIEKLVLIDLPKLTKVFKNQRGVVLTKLKTLKIKNLATLDSLDFKAEGLEVLEIENAPKLSVDRLLSFIEGTQRLTSIIVDRTSEAIKHLAASLYQTGRYIEQDEKQAERYFSQLPDSQKYKDYLQGRFIVPLDTILLTFNMRIGAYKRIVLRGLNITDAEVEGLAALLAYENNGIMSIDLTENKVSENGCSLLKESVDMKQNAQLVIKLSPGEYIYNEASITSLLEDTYWGRQDKIEGIVSTKPSLLRIKGNCTDLSGRQFNGITAFQYAWWACDWYMWRMMIKYMDKAEVLRQVDEIESNSLAWVLEHGQEFDISGLTQAYDNYINNFDEWSWFWRQQAWFLVGQQQLLCPAHIYNHCLDYGIRPINMQYPNFRDEKEPPRYAGDGCAWWYYELDIACKLHEAAVLEYPRTLGRRADMIIDKKSSVLCMSTRRAQKGELLHVLRYEAGIEHGQDLSL